MTHRSRHQGLALFDLDHTLIPFDSGGAFTRWLIDQGVLDAGFEAQYLAYCRDYAAGRLDIRAMHRHTVGTLSRHGPARLQAWLAAFGRTLGPQLPAAAQALVQRHRAAGDVCVLVTATTRFIAEVFAAHFGIAHVLATEAARDADGHYTGEVIGEPCFRAAKRRHLAQWLARTGWCASPPADDALPALLASLPRCSFHSDSQHDLPLLQAVPTPVAVDPDPALAAHALAHGWPVISLRG